MRAGGGRGASLVELAAELRAIESAHRTTAPFGLAPARLTVDASADGGRTWQPARVSTGGPRGHLAEISRPAGADSLDLRARFTDDRGNAVDQTIYDALTFTG